MDSGFFCVNDRLEKTDTGSLIKSASMPGEEAEGKVIPSLVESEGVVVTYMSRLCRMKH